MHIVVLAAFAVVRLLAEMRILLLASRGLAVGIVAAYLAGAVILARIASQAAMESAVASPRRGLSTGKPLLRLLTHLWLLGGLACISVTSYGQWMFSGPPSQIPLAATVGAMLPFFAAVVAGWIVEYPAHRAFRLRLVGQNPPGEPQPAGPLSLGQYVLLNTRHELLFIAAPVGMLVLLGDVLSIYVEPALSPRVAPWVMLPMMFAGMGGVFIIAPAVIVKVWSTEPLGSGPLRESLEKMARMLGVRFRRMLIWRSGGVIINAAVVGLLGRFRYVLLSDAMLRQMPQREIEAVFAHEAQHIAGHHIFYGTMLILSLSLAITGASELLRLKLGWGSWGVDAAGLMLLAAALYVAFGWVSRRLERQCDVHAAKTAGALQGSGGDQDVVSQEGAAIFAMALQRVAQLNAISPLQRNWRHGSIHWRINHVLDVASAGKGTGDIDRLVRRIKLCLWAGFVCSCALVGWAALSG
jgi:STE24 endopeptidase